MKFVVEGPNGIEVTIALYAEEDAFDIRINNNIGPCCSELWSEDMPPATAIDMFHRLVDHAIKARAKEWHVLEHELKAMLRRRLVA